MANFVSAEDISRLKHDAFRKVLNSVIMAEADVAEVSLVALNLTTRDTDPDGGVDGRLQWPLTAAHDILSPGDTVIQYKSGKLTDAELAKEFVKPGVLSTLKSHGNYVLFVGQDYVDPTRKARARKLKELCKKKKVAFSRCKIVYGDQIAHWVSQHIGVVIVPELERSLPSFVTIETLSLNPNLRNPYQPDPSRKETIERIRDFVHHPNGDNAIRIEGPAGVGKTRVLLEALNQPGLAQRSLYCANAEDPSAQQLVATLCSQPKAEAIIVLDECDSERQQSLKAYSELTNGRVILVCAGVTDVLFQAPPGLSNVYTLLPLEEDDIRSILQKHTPDAPVEIVDTAVRLSGGYVKLAIFVFTTLLRANRISLTDLAKLYDIRQFLQRFVSESTYKTLKVLSLLAKVGWRDERRAEADALAHELSLPVPDMEEAVAKLLDQGVVIERGFSLYVSPDLLAISAAAAMWDEKGPGLIQIVKTLPGTGPKRQLLRRLATMHEHPTVIRAVEMLLGPAGLYQSIDDLDQQFLSEIFRFFASALPPTAVEVLERIIPETSIERLRSFSKGRREVVWAIESLLRWPETSLRAARVLIRLALSENESISNNATGITETFFHAFLSGSPLPLKDRLMLVEEILAVPLAGNRVLAVKALSGSVAFHESRMGNEVDYISKRVFPKEWRPLKWGELWEARQFAVDMLWKIATATDEAAALARRELLNSISTLVRDGQLEDAISILKQIQPQSDEERLDCLEAIHRIKNNADLKLSPDQASVLSSLSETAFENNLFDQLRRWTGKRALFDYKSDGEGFSKVDQCAAELADRAFLEGLSTDAWEWLASPAAEHVWPFGRRLGLLDVENVYLEKIVAATPRNLNVILLASYLSGKTDNERDDILDRLAESETILAFVATWRNGTTVRGGQRILGLMDSVPVQFWGVLKYGNWVSPLPDEIKVPMLKKMFSNPEGQEFGSSLVVHLAMDDRTWVLSHPDLLWSALAVLPTGVGSEWEWGQLAQLGIEQNPKKLANIALNFLLKDDDVHLSSHPVVRALAQSTKVQPSAIWKNVGRALLSRGTPAFRLLLSLNHWYGELIPADDLVQWALKFGKRARIIAMDLVSIAAPLPERARELLLAFPDDDSLLNALGGQLFSGSWTGPISGHTEAVLKTIEILESDPNPRVSAWASRLRKGTAQQLERQKLQEEEEEF